MCVDAIQIFSTSYRVRKPDGNSQFSVHFNV